MNLYQALSDATPVEAALAPAVDAPDASLARWELGAMAEGAAEMLGRVYGMRPGDRIAYLGFNSAALLVLIFAASRAGFIVSQSTRLKAK